MFDPLWTQRPFVPIATDRLLLRPVAKVDAEPMAKILNDIRISERLSRVPFPFSIDDANQFISQTQTQFKTAEAVVLSIVDRKTNEFLGVCSIEEELGIWLGYPHWGKGYGSEAMQALVHFAFSALKLPLLKASALEHNSASRNIFEGLGFKTTGKEGRFSVATNTTNQGVTFEITRDEYFTSLHQKQLPIIWVAAAALIDEEGRLLLAERPEGKSLEGVWELPGGKIEDGETPDQALVRELFEELHIDVELQDLETMTFASYHYHTFHLVMPLFLCKKWKGDPIGKEGQDLRWIKYPDLSTIATPSADILLFHKIAAYFRDQGIW
jgi:8-oxo-dGTP diphosphatase